MSGTSYLVVGGGAACAGSPLLPAPLHLLYEFAHFAVGISSSDGRTRVNVDAEVASQMPADSVFHTLDEASSFFEAGSLGYSVGSKPATYDGLELRTARWSVEPLDVHRVESSFFDDGARFPTGSAVFDDALLMRDIRHEWHGRDELRGSSEL